MLPLATDYKETRKHTLYVPVNGRWAIAEPELKWRREYDFRANSLLFNVSPDNYAAIQNEVIYAHIKP